MRTTLLVLLFLITTLSAQALPAYEGYVTDQAGLFTSEERLALEQALQHIERNTTAEIAVVTVKSLEGLSVEDYTIKLAEQWKVGKKDVDNGLIILIAPNERAYRIEVGYGLEGTLPDGLIGRLGREILVPAFRNQEYGKGVLELVNAIHGHLENNSEIVSRYKPSPLNTVIMWLIVLVFIGAFGLMAYYAVKQQFHPPRKGPGRTGWGGPIFLGGRGGGSGGFGGFGGGGFGGGGAGGRW